jgi:hypothetical protein
MVSKSNNYKKTVGSRAEVYHGTAKHTSGSITKNGLMKNKHGRIVSRKKHFFAKKNKFLVKAGYKTTRGVFKLFHKNSSRSTKRRRRMNGGMALGGMLAPSHYDGKGVHTSGNALQFIAGNGN